MRFLKRTIIGAALLAACSAAPAAQSGASAAPATMPAQRGEGAGEVLAGEDYPPVAPRGFSRGLLHTLAAAPRGD